MQIPEEDILLREDLESGWKLVVYMKDGKKCTRIFNPTETSEEQYFAIDTAKGKYGAPMLEKEPSLKIPIIINDAPYEIVGIVILDENGEIKDRFSLSNLKFSRKQNFELKKSESGYEFFIDGESQGYLNTVFNIDKNRVVGYEAIFTHSAPAEVQVLELESLGKNSANANK